ncbi:ornithine cyclodeaminase family protein [Streptomyces sp. NPDC048462]|uniref:ornithine cyclodeaminase family protein n=1 Tax=Streptomyces sp. NPDC048462 TaxID=3365555 RepID=UPI003717B0B1
MDLPVPDSRLPAPQLFDDDDVRGRLDAATAVRAVRSALLAHHRGTLHAPPRVRADIGDGQLAFTAGRLREQGVFGFRVYHTAADAEQLVAVWDAAGGRLRALVHGSELGARRTGALGAVAVDAAACPGPVRLALVGAGVQAWAQLWALRAVREIEEAVVVARRPHRAAAFARRATEELGLTVGTAASVEDAGRGRNVVIIATDSGTPVLDTAWIGPGTHVTTLGPKSASRHEIPASLAERADVILTDSRAQAAGYAEPHLVAAERMTDLGAVLAGAAAGRTGPGQITLYCSTGLAGTEVALAAALCAPGVPGAPGVPE